MLRIITLGQATYFVVNSIARLAQGLTITPMELTVLGFVLCTYCSSICWWHKPNDVELGHTLEMDCTINEVLLQAGDVAKGIYYDTPLDFLESTGEWVTTIFIFYANILKWLRIVQEVHKVRPAQKISVVKVPRLKSLTSSLIMAPVGFLYLGSFFGAWNYEFPTTTERSIWRVIAIVHLCISFLAGLLGGIVFTKSKSWAEAIEEKPHNTDAEALSSNVAQRRMPLFRRWWNRPCNNCAFRHPCMNVRLGPLLVLTPMCAAYVVCRWFLLVEDIAGLRSLPEGAYKDVNWHQYWPSLHI